MKATALLVDMRNFTPTYAAFSQEGREAEFLDLLDRFYGIVADTCRAACGGAPADSLYLNSTGDGVLAVFIDEADGSAHGLRAYLASVRLLETLPVLFAAATGRALSFWEPTFGIGMESGEVTSVGPDRLRTCIGHCVNIAARLEALTKTIAATSLIVGEETNALLTRELGAGSDYGALSRRALDPALDRAEREDLWRQMRSANDALCLHWFGYVHLKGVDRPLLAFRSTPTQLAHDRGELIARLERRLVNQA